MSLETEETPRHRESERMSNCPERRERAVSEGSVGGGQVREHLRSQP
jgi:hypothetical protein